ncbi:MAG: hypothetical protein ACPGYV_14360, partial [Phycisphaeraceae bacterium]
MIELLVVISIIALLIAILLPALSKARFTAVVMQNSTQQRGNFQAFYMYAETNKGQMPGLENRTGQAALIPATRGGRQTSSANRDGDWPAARFALIVDNDCVAPDYVINPGEIAPREPWTFGQDGLDSN